MTAYFPKPRTLADAVDKVARQSAGKDWGLYAGLLSHWTEIVGADYARVTTPVKIAFPYQPGEAQRKDGVLTVRLPKGLAMEFSFKADIIRRRINAYLGYEAFARIALAPAAAGVPVAAKQPKPIAPAALKAIQEQVSSIENNELKDVLESFGKAMASR
ncbi:MAG: DUF721 domain-containing protein [Alphaproteobacteria bacterium]|nr:DUF721 domain-containing protein [Alphaproteobacteria bacterium]